MDQNKGYLKALEAKKSYEGKLSLVLPDFDNIEPSKEASDWNDLARICGIHELKRQLIFLSKQFN